MVSIHRLSVHLLWLVSSVLARGTSYAVNNNTRGRLDTNNCIYTQAGDRNLTWYVDLGKVYKVWEVVIYGRTDYLRRMVDVSVKVDQLECARITKEPTDDRIPVPCKETIFGQNITMEKQYNKTGYDEENVLQICEVQIWVCDPEYFGDRCDQPCGKCNDTVCGRKDGKCRLLPCLPGYSGDTCQTQNPWDTKLVVGVSCGGILGLIASVVICYVISRRCRANTLCQDSLSVTDSTEHAHRAQTTCRREQCVQNSRSSGECLEVCQKWRQRTEVESEAHWERLKVHILEKLQRGVLDTEFSRLTRGIVYACTNATMRKNRRKNRFRDILPYDSTRVVLETDDGQECSNYINASYIQGYRTDEAYIAAQGPIQNTEDAFWRMVWQQNVTQIIMLTKVMTSQENTASAVTIIRKSSFLDQSVYQSEFFKYWPSAGEKQRYGQVEVSNVDEVSNAHFVVRTFSVKKDNEFRHVDHFQFTGFTDQETRSTVPFVQFWRFVTSRPLRNLLSPPVIHCSAGVGQTGVYIALDVIMKQTQLETDVSIFDVVSRMRQDRCNMVNHQDYYYDLHTAVLEACVSRNTCLDMESFERVFSEPVDVCRPNNIIDNQCQILKIMPDVLLDECYASVCKNKGETSRMCITMRVAERYLSINAVFLPTVLDARGIIVTQFPDSMETVWGLIECYSFREIVSLGNVQEQTDEPYWPTQTGSELGAGMYTIALTSKTDLGECLTSYNLTWQRRRDSGQVRLLHYCDWQEDLPDNTQELVYLLSLLAKTLHDKEHAPLLVQCLDGSVRSSMFCVLCHLMSQIAVDGSIDVFSAVRHVQSVVPEFGMSTEQYRFCYRVAQQLQQSDNIYANVWT